MKEYKIGQDVFVKPVLLKKTDHTRQWWIKNDGKPAPATIVSITDADEGIYKVELKETRQKIHVPGDSEFHKITFVTPLKEIIKKVRHDKKQL